MGKLHHLDVGCGDASVIQTASATFLVDCHDIDRYAHLLPRSRVLRGVFITHQHRDHHSGLAYLRSAGYKIEWLIYSPYKRRHGDASVTKEEWDDFRDHLDFFVQLGTRTRAAYRQDNFTKPYWTTDGISFWMLAPDRRIADTDTRQLHDACLVIKAHLGRRRCLFAGDASDASAEYVAAHTINICDDILHASHHGSLEGAALSFIKKCGASYTVISTEEGVYENIPHPMALRRYHEHTKNKVYRTDQDNSLAWSF